ncbi:MAG TPA: DUF3488 and transglutaminase-like domain-containing protein [Beutenbergiaceae bacterium]|nr:DUF3488 and transglutaminase-like domain-containing protein [Beutenbergiaceae bacterium]
MTRPAAEPLTVVMLAIASGAGALSMVELVQPGSWLTPTMLVLAATGAILVLGRWRLESRWLPSILGLLGGGYLTTALFTEGQGWAAPLPSLAAPGQVVELFRAGAHDAATTTAPVADSPGLALAITSGALITLLLAELMAGGAQAPAWSGLPLLLPWVPTAALGATAPTPAFVVAAGGYLAVLVLHAAPGGGSGARRRSGWASAAVTAALAVVLALVAAPAVSHLPVPTWQIPGGSGGSTRLDLGLDVRDHLTRGADDVVIRYQADDPDEIGPLHLVTLTEFSGRQWEASADEGDTTPVADDVLWPAPAADGDGHRMRVDMLDLAQGRLALPAEPRRLEVDGDWFYHAARDEVLGAAAAPLQYEAEIYPRELSPHTLNEVPLAESPDPEALRVPDTGHREQIEALTERVVTAAQAATPYQQAVAIQDHLRHDSHFTYDLQVDPARTDDAVWDFLGSGRGYCVQFATAMVVMARTLGIPARLAVGFLDGEQGEDGAVEITGHRAHTWPQLYFSGVGWVRFEPTPPERTGSPPSWAAGMPADENAEAGMTPQTPTQTPEPRPSRASSQELGSTSGSGSGNSDDAWWPMLALLGGLGLIGSWWRFRRRRSGEVETAWRDVRRAARTVGRAPPSETPRAMTGRLRLPDRAQSDLARLAEAVEQQRYARPGAEAPRPETVRSWRAQILRALRRTRSPEASGSVESRHRHVGGRR